LQLHLRSAGLAAGLLTLVLAAPALAAPANVTVRIEGAGRTLLEQTSVRTSTAPVNKSGQPGQQCNGTSAAGALELATSGDWGGNWFDGFGYSVERIFTESHPFDDPNGDFWAEWVNYRSGQGLCADELQEGDELVFFVDRCQFDPATQRCGNEPVLPLELSVPASATAGTPVTATVVKHEPDGSPTAPGKTVISGDGVQATTGDDGKAEITFTREGSYRLKADQAGAARSAAETVVVSAPGAPPAEPAAPVARDTAAPVARIRGIRNGQRFKRRKAPRTLRGTVSPDPSGLRAVKLSLTRSVGGRCQLYSPSKERFRRSRCGRRVNFTIGDRQEWSYLLPKRLGKGRYVLDAIAVDRLGNRDTLARGRNRVVFFVR
jgi:hypothetical protein